eukprot:CAMPEP_0195305838 /NCGR_PEP_ID=MMETSP0707-20130614/36894_1 /TAXON_ID=33640 /ORGANISM="Asterionellopsis glacialis, Strain CCMP134" /LENGTH=1004 /DNA_ID=CAMNT_0040370041 /DNA_START=447 /DNA_END=3461 /DNA_ORIENTATION=+
MRQSLPNTPSGLHSHFTRYHLKPLKRKHDQLLNTQNHGRSVLITSPMSNNIPPNTAISDCPSSHEISSMTNNLCGQNSATDDMSLSTAATTASVSCNNTKYARPQSSRYFTAYSKSQGSAHLVGLSQFGFDCPKDQINSDEILLHIKLAEFSSKLSRGQCQEFTSILNLCCRTLEKKKHTYSTTIPVSYNLLQSQALLGKNSIVANLPYPKVHSLDDNHSYVSIRDCIADILGFGFPLDTIPLDNHYSFPVQYPSNSRHALQNIRERALAIFPDHPSLKIIWFNEWSDDFEGNISSKSRSPVWVKTITICPPPSFQLHKKQQLNYTYPIALGPKGANHNIVEKHLAEELKSLQINSPNNFFYDFASRTIVPVYVDMFVSMMDQPERRSANSIMLGTSTYTARWGMSLDFTSVANTIPTCAECLSKSTLSGGNRVIPNNSDCNQCCSWNLESDKNVLQFDPPNDYPPDAIPPCGKLSPIVLTYEKLRNCVTQAHNNIVNQTWSTKNAICFLRTHGLNKEALDRVTTHAENCLALALAQEQDPTDITFLELSNDKEENPHLFKEWDVPSLWNRGTNISQHIEAIMHLLFLGVTKKIIKMINTWLTLKMNYSEFLVMVKPLLDGIRGLNLPWLNVQPFLEGKLGTWVAENYMGFSRIALWFYGSVLPHLQYASVFVNPTQPTEKWTKTQNYRWLQVRGLDTEGNALTLRQRVSFFLSQDGGPPLPLPPKGCDVNDVMKMLQAHNIMISNLMVDVVQEDTVTLCTQSIHHFLDTFEVFDSSMRNVDEKPSWISSYNFLCLLNLPYIMDEYGPLRTLWEGGLQGEGFIRLIKPYIVHGLRRGWQSSLMKGTLERMSLSRVQHSTRLELQCVDDEFIESCTKIDFYVHQSTNEAMHRFISHKPLSVVYTVHGNWYMLCRNNEKHGESTFFGMRISHQSYIGNEQFMDYHKYDLNFENGDVLDTVPISSVTLSAVFLPKVNEDQIYTGVDTRWFFVCEDPTLFFRPRLSST